ncbi:hypothetical protein NLI96_g4535 [Meripilus lineatus]|uniref:Uncharacterized protein n=1 Tax=Meripilus lineatus TaxID=2056292 RepID=A0AAD5V6E8_9APHY|nr:hypothetical protein NLI96_g4535 [Physisporinus lineatus]
MAIPWPTERDLLTAASLLGTIISLVPLCWQIRAWNVGCFLFGFWTGTTSFVQFINFIVWRNTSQNLAPVWCEISIRYIWIGSIGLVTAALAVAHRTAMIATGKHLGPNLSQSRMVFVDLSIGLLPPLSQLIISVCTLPLAAFFVYANLTQVPVVPWKGLADLHRDYGKIGHFSLDEWIQDSRIVIEFENWITIACALVFFIFFGLTEEARKHYRFAFHRVRRWLKVPASRSARSETILVLPQHSGNSPFHSETSLSGSAVLGIRRPKSNLVASPSDVPKHMESS